MRIRIEFAKTAHMRYTGHLDLHRTWERTFRRAGLPLAYSQGYHPKPKLNLASALPLGFTSECEVLDAWLEEDLPLEEVFKRLREAAPPGIHISAVQQADEREPALQVQVQAAEYVITLLDPPDNLVEKVEALLAAGTLPRERRGKPYDLRVLVQALTVLSPDEDGQARLFARLEAREGATGRPEEVLDQLGYDSLRARIQRTQLIFAGSKNKS